MTDVTTDTALSPETRTPIERGGYSKLRSAIPA